MAERKARVELLVATLAILVSLAALFVSMMEVNVMRSEVQLMRAQERAAVWPYLELTISYDKLGFAVEVVNKGIGPALVRHVSVGGAEAQQYTSWPEVIDAILSPGHGLSWSNYLTSNLSRTVLSPQEEITAFRYPDPSTAAQDGAWTDQAHKLAQGMEALSWEVCYCSVLQDCWLHRRGEEPQPAQGYCENLTPAAFQD